MQSRLVRKNYRDEMIPAAYGIYVVIAALLGIAAAWQLHRLDGRLAAIYAGAIGSMGILGLVDDLFGNRDVGGFRGHFRRLFREGKLTTGAIKAIGGGIAAIVIGAAISLDASISLKDVLKWLLATGLVAFSANALNLLDLRPGRAAAAFFAGLIIAVASAGFAVSGAWAVGAVALPAFVGYLWDRNARAMMGDVGSNSLGAALGVTLAVTAPTKAQIVFLFLLMALNVYSEKRSVTQAIERHPILKRIDSITGVR